MSQENESSIGSDMSGYQWNRLKADPREGLFP